MFVTSFRMAAFRMLALLAFCLAVCPSVYGYGRIVGGEDSDIMKRPYQASLQYHVGSSVQHSCGGSIISTKFILSAAHCDPGNNIVIYYARVGSTAYNTGGQEIKIASFVQHPLYSRNTLDYDFGILSFPEGVEIVLGPGVAIIPLTSGNDPDDSSLVTVSGWGVTSESASTVPIILQEADLPVVNQDRCRETYSFITSRQTCLGGTPQGMLSACFGDSGGPGVQNGVQYVLVSGGNSCELPNIPGIYARVSSVRSWITDLTGV